MIIKNLEVLIKIIREFADNAENTKKMEKIILKLTDCLKLGNKILVCGNGGSACDAIHFAEEFTGRYRKNREPLPVLALTDPGAITCIANDFGFEEIFSRQVTAYGKKGDVLILISTSGNSENLLRANQSAKEKGLFTIAFLGKKGGKLLKYADETILIPDIAETSDRIQEIQMALLHIIIEGVERNLFPQLY